MQSKTLIVLLVAVACGGSAAFMTSRLLADRSEKVAILVAKQRLGPWTPIKNPEEQFELEERSKNEIPKNALTRIDSVRDHIVVRGIDRGDAVVADNLVDKNKGGLEVLLPSGKRAVAVRTTAEQVAGGFVLPGSRVDVIHTIRRNDREAESHVVLQNILVRAVDQQAMKPDDKPGLVPATVTLEVTPQQAIIVARVKDSGTITLALRPMGDEHLEPNEELIAAAPAPPKVELKPEPPKVEPKPEPPKAEVAAKTPEPEPESPVEKTVLVIQNGSQWLRATYLTQDGETKTTVERIQQDAVPALPGRGR